MTLRWQWLGRLAMVVCLGGCTVSPQPLPPDIGTAGLTLETSGAGRIRLRGAPGSLDGAETLRVTNLANAAAPSEVAPRPDGSFDVELEGALSDVLRLQARAGDQRSEVLDVTGNGEGAPVVEAPVASPCLTLAREIAGAPVALSDPIQPLVVTAHNGCTADVTIAEIPFRAAQPEFVLLVAGQLPRVMAPGERFDIEIGFKSMTRGEFEEVALVTLETTGGPVRAVTVRGTTR